jgi:predicted nuclease of predicted toxin-antitoxin system
MKVLFDECVPWPARTLLHEHQCTSVQKRGWGGIKNGELVKLAELEFEVLITCDQNLRYQQNLVNRRLAILELSTNDLRRIQKAGDELRRALAKTVPGAYVHVEIP